MDVKTVGKQWNKFFECKKGRKTRKLFFGMKISSKNKETIFNVKTVENQWNEVFGM